MLSRIKTSFPGGDLIVVQSGAEVAVLAADGKNARGCRKMSKDKKRKMHLAETPEPLRSKSEQVVRYPEVDDLEESRDPSDFMRRDIGTMDFTEAVEEAEPYFPPTDPVVEPTREHYREIEVVGGYAGTSMDELEDSYESSTGGSGDEQITDEVSRELREDAGTTALSIRVETVDGVVHLQGVVPSLEDVELAEEVASRIPGVVEVSEELDIEGLA